MFGDAQRINLLLYYHKMMNLVQLNVHLLSNRSRQAMAMAEEKIKRRRIGGLKAMKLGMIVDLYMINSIRSFLCQQRERIKW